MKPYPIFGIGILLAIASVAPLHPVIVVGPSMTPTFESGTILVGRSNFRAVHRGDVVVVDTPVGKSIKRVALLAGDHYRQYLRAGEWFTPLHIGGKFRLDGIAKQSRDRVVPAGCVYVLGDNELESVDSRTFGPVPVANVQFIIDSAPKRADFGFAGQALASRLSLDRES